MIGIKDMKMPNSCGECNFVFNEEGYVQLCRINDEVVEDYYFDKNPNCPLIEIVEGEVK
jgi:hypothetical protein